MSTWGAVCDEQDHALLEPADLQRASAVETPDP